MVTPSWFRNNIKVNGVVCDSPARNAHWEKGIRHFRISARKQHPNTASRLSISVPGWGAAAGSQVNEHERLRVPSMRQAPAILAIRIEFKCRLTAILTVILLLPR